MQQTADNVIACILRQLLQHKALPGELDKAYDKWIERGQRNRPDGDFFAELVLQCSKQFSAVFIVLDAFDECADEERDVLVNYLQQFLNAGFKLYITTRLHLRDGLVESLGMFGDMIEIKADPADVEKYVKESLKTRLIGNALKDEILKVIMEAEAREYNRPFDFNLIVDFYLYDSNWNIFWPDPPTSGPPSIRCQGTCPRHTEGSLNESRKGKIRQQLSKYCRGYSSPEGF